MDEYEEGGTVYLPDGSKGEIIGLSHRGSDYLVNGIHAEFRGPDGLDHRWFDPEEVHRLSFDQRLRRIEEKLGIDD